MADNKNDDGASAQTRIPREIRPAGKPQHEAPKPIPVQDAGSGAAGATMIRGYGGGSQQISEKDTGGFDPVVGWLVVVEGPGRGKAVNIHAGMNSLGRNANQRISVNFGDASISGEAAAFITFEPKRCTFHINHGGKANIVYLNEEAVLTPMPLVAGNIVTIGETKLRFVPLCGADFNWEDMK
jgi:hypothetical protein